MNHFCCLPDLNKFLIGFSNNTVIKEEMMREVIISAIMGWENPRRNFIHERLPVIVALFLKLKICCTSLRLYFFHSGIFHQSDKYENKYLKKQNISFCIWLKTQWWQDYPSIRLQHQYLLCQRLFLPFFALSYLLCTAAPGCAYKCITMKYI